MARQYLRLTPETTWGTYDDEADPVIVDLDQDNSFTMRVVPQKWSIVNFATGARRAKTGSSKKACSGNLNTLLYGSQAAALIPWMVANASGAIGSMTIDHAIVMDDNSNTTVYRRYLGAVVGQAQFAAAAGQQLMRLSLQLTAKQPATITITDFAEPAIADYPWDAPYVLEHASAITLGTSRAEFDDFNLTVKNKFDFTYFNSQYITRAKYCGREVDWSVTFPYGVTIDRTNFEAVTGVAASCSFVNGAHTLAFNMQSKNFYDSLEDDLGMDKVFLQKLSMQAYFDSGAGTPNDFTLAQS